MTRDLCCGRPVELRGVERKALLEALREPLLPDTVCYNAQVVGIQKIDGGYTEIKLQNGSFIKTKVFLSHTHTHTRVFFA